MICEPAPGERVPPGLPGLPRRRPGRARWAARGRPGGAGGPGGSGLPRRLLRTRTAASQPESASRPAGVGARRRWKPWCSNRKCEPGLPGRGRPGESAVPPTPPRPRGRRGVGGGGPGPPFPLSPPPPSARGPKWSPGERAGAVPAAERGRAPRAPLLRAPAAFLAGIRGRPDPRRPGRAVAPHGSPGKKGWHCGGLPRRLSNPGRQPDSPHCTIPAVELPRDSDGAQKCFPGFPPPGKERLGNTLCARVPCSPLRCRARPFQGKKSSLARWYIRSRLNATDMFLVPVCVFRQKKCLDLLRGREIRNWF